MQSSRHILKNDHKTLIALALLSMLSSADFYLIFRKKYTEDPFLLGLNFLLFLLATLIASIALTKKKSFVELRLESVTRLFCLFLSLGLGIAVVFGTNIEVTYSSKLTSLFTYFKIALFFPGLYIIFTAGIKLVRILLEIHPKEQTEHTLKSRYLLLLIVLIMLICWLPIFLAYYPGLYGYDSIFQTRQSVLGYPLTSHHPILHTLLLGFFINFGISVADSASFGFSLYIMLQMIFMATCFSTFCLAIFRFSKSRILLFASTAWFAICPLNSVLSISCTKDVIFTGFLTLSFSSLIMITMTSKKNSRIAFVALFIVSATFALLFRNNALYAYIILTIILLFIFIREKTNSANRRRLLLASLMPLALSLIFSFGMNNALNVQNSTSTAESMSVPIQQLARVMNTDSDDLSPAQKEFIETYVPNWAAYKPGISDPTKNSFDSTLFRDDPFYFFQQYVEIGLQHPLTYIESFLMNTYGYWYPDTTGLYLGGWFYHPYLETVNTNEDREGEYLYIHTDSMLPGLRDKLTYIIDNRLWEKVPILNLIMNPGSQIWILAFALLCPPTKQRNTRMRYYLVFLCLYWFTCLLGPCLLVRYLYPLYAALPGTIVYAFFPRDQTSIHDVQNIIDA